MITWLERAMTPEDMETTTCAICGAEFERAPVTRCWRRPTSAPRSAMCVCVRGVCIAFFGARKSWPKA